MSDITVHILDATKLDTAADIVTHAKIVGLRITTANLLNEDVSRSAAHLAMAAQNAIDAIRVMHKHIEKLAALGVLTQVN